ncbi:MAG: hypothetical protein K2N80_14495 [Lachnospiraceae bacterium]|nr:hypothetical protein [Lachnospiraceae bacterium]
MKKRQLLGIITGICLVFAGCGADKENTDDSLQKLQAEDIAAESVSEGAENGKAAGQTAEENEREEALEQTAEGMERETVSAEEVSMEDTSDKTEALLPDDSYAAAYRRFLETYVEESEYVNWARAMLAFIDDDNIPELLLIEDCIHAAGVKVYTYDQKAVGQEAVIELGVFGSMGRMQYVERGGMICSGFSGMGECDSAFYQVKDGEVKLVCSLMSYQPPDGRPEIYRIDGVSVTAEAHNKKWDELYEAGEYVMIGYDDAFAIKELEPADLLAEAVNALLLHRESPQLADMVAEQSEVLEGYGAFLAEYASQRDESDSREVPGFAFTYLDGDDVPELIVIDGYAHSCGAAVYTFEKGEVISVGAYGQYGAMGYREKEGIVFDDYDTGGNVYSSVYQIEGKEETLLQSYSERCDFSAEGEEVQYAYMVDGKEVSEEQYREVCDKWNESECRVIDYGMCRALEGGNLQSALTEELENLLLTQEEALKQNVLIAAGAQESDILLLDYDDYDRDGKCEAFMICGDSYDEYGEERYRGELYFAGADCCTLLRDDQCYRMIDGKMKLGMNRKYLFFYTDFSLTANISELWTVEDGKPVENEFSQIGQVVYRGGNAFEIWMDTYDHFYEPAYDMWTGHTYKPYFYYYNYSRDRIEAYGGEIISGEEFGKLSGTNLIGEIEAEGYTVETIIRWENDIVTINYVIPADERDSTGTVCYENVIWDNTAKDFWQKDVRGVTSWKNAGEGGRFRI